MKLKVWEIKMERVCIDLKQIENISEKLKGNSIRNSHKKHEECLFEGVCAGSSNAGSQSFGSRRLKLVFIKKPKGSWMLPFV